MDLVLTLFTAIATCLAIVPLMMRYAHRLGMVDVPSARKVHGRPVPRVGGWGIVLGAIVAIVAWAPLDRVVLSYLFGVIVLFIFGVWDDRRDLGHYPKFAGQLLAALPIVTFAGVYVTDFPFLGEGVVPAGYAMLFSVFALVGMANAVNHSDGLDGLAGGESTLTLVAIAILSYLANGNLGVLIALAVLGGLFGFLRYNTHPAVVFMGDNGSQAIGFSLGVLAILLTQTIDPTLSPAVAMLLLGLPVPDILFVLYRRIREGRSWFKATKNHVHHRLMERGFTHKEAVVIIYSIHIAFVGSGVLLRHASDWLIASVYLGGCTLVFSALAIAERVGWTFRHVGHPRAPRTPLLTRAQRKALLVAAPRRFLEIAIPAYLVFASIAVSDVTPLFGLMAVALFGMLLVNLLMGKEPRSVARRGLLFAVGALVVYLGFVRGEDAPLWIQWVQYGFFAVVGIAIITAVHFNPRHRKLEFEANAMDYLILLVVLIPLLIVGPTYDASGGFLVALLVLMYGLELLVIERREQRAFIWPAALTASCVLVIKGLVL